MNTASTFGEELLRIAPADIHIPRRLGLYFPDKAVALGKMIAARGQHTPVVVRVPNAKERKETDRPWSLIAGLHRVRGVELENLDFVLGIERIGGTAADAADIEASENLDRRDQLALEKAIFIHATCEAAKARLGLTGSESEQQKLAAKARWDRVRSGEMRPEQALQDEADDARSNMERAYGWEESVAQAFNRGRSDIYRALKLHRMIIAPFPGLVQELSDHPVVGNNQKQLLDIADIKDEAQRLAVIKQLLGNHELSADEALVLVGIGRPAGPDATPLPYMKHVNAISGGLSRLSAPQQKQHIDTIIGALKNDEVKRQMRDRLNEELGE